MNKRTQRTVCVCVCARVLAFEKQVCVIIQLILYFQGGITG